VAEALGAGGVGRVQGGLSLGADLAGGAVVDAGGGVQPDGLIELHRRVARGLTNFENYRLRMLLIGGGLNL
jgi:hypothetical protein